MKLLIKRIFVFLISCFSFCLFMAHSASAEVIYSTEGKFLEKISSLSSKDGKKVLSLSNGSSLALESVVKISFASKKESSLLDETTAVVVLNSGDLLKGTLQKGGTLDITLSIPDVGMVPISLDYLRGIFFLDQIKSSQERDEFFQKTLSQAPQQDQIFLKKGGQIPCVIQAILPDQIQIQVGGVGNKQIEIKDLLALQIAPLGGAFSFPQTPYVKVYLNRGEILAGEIVSYEKDTLCLKTFFGKTLNIPYQRLLEIYFFQGKFAYLSDLKPSQIQLAPGFSAMSGKSFPPHYDENLNGKELKISGISYQKGLGLHSKTTLTYSLEGKFTQLMGLVGFDDSIREFTSSYTPTIVFRVYGDGQKLFDSGILTPKDSTKAIQISLSSCQKMIIEVDFGEMGNDIQGRLNFVDAVLIKK